MYLHLDLFKKGLDVRKQEVRVVTKHPMVGGYEDISGASCEGESLELGWVQSPRRSITGRLVMGCSEGALSACACTA